MLISPLLFKEFDAQDVPGKTVRKKTLTPSGGKEEENLPPPPPTFSEEQLKAAERDAYQKGFLEGTRDGHAQAQNEHADIERHLTQTLEHFIHAVTPIFTDYGRSIEALKQDMPKLSLAIAKKVAAEALSNDAAAIVEGAVLKSLEAMTTEPQIHVIVNETLAPALDEKIKQLAVRMQAASHIIVQPDSNIPLADWRVEWKHGSQERNTERVWAHIEQAINNMLATTAREHNEQMNVLDADIKTISEKE